MSSPEPSLKNGFQFRTLRPAWGLGVLGLLVITAVVVAVMGRWIDLTKRDTPSATKSIVAPSSPDSATVIPARDYVGHTACVACHASRVAEFEQTNHPHTCRIATPVLMQGVPPDGVGRFQTRSPDLRYEISCRDNQVFQKAIRRDSSRVITTDSRVDLILGAGDIDEVFLSWRDDGQMFELPMSWIQSSRQWAGASWWRAARFFEEGPPDGARQLTVRCLECHTTWFEHVVGTPNQYHRQNFLPGVTCERCHGPAREHVVFHQTHPAVTEPHAIVQPAMLARERQIEVCTQCHGNAVKHRGPALSYRPGKPLEQYYRTSQSRFTEDDHVANQIGYLRNSKCFQNSDMMTCVSCHNPHRTKADAHPGKIENACLPCHRKADCGEREKLPVALQDECIKCHMPSYLKINVHFQTEHDDFVSPMRRIEHRIGVYPSARDEVLWNWHCEQPDAPHPEQAKQLAVSLASHWKQEAEKCRAAHRLLGHIAARREVLRFEDSDEARDHLQQAIALQDQVDEGFVKARRLIEQRQVQLARPLLEQVIRLKPNYAPAVGELGTLLGIDNQQGKAFEYLTRVSQFDRDDPYGEAMMGWMSYLHGEFQEALVHFRKADEIEPYNARIHLRMALSLIKLNRNQEAVAELKHVLQIEPANLDASQHLTATLRAMGNAKEAIPYARLAAAGRKNQELESLLIIIDTCVEAGDMTLAIEAAEMALQVAEQQQSTLTESIRRRLAAYRRRQ